MGNAPPSGASEPEVATHPDSASPVVPDAAGPLLAFVGGLVDTSGFLLLSGVFVAHITGNFVVFGASLDRVGSSWSLLANAIVLPLYVVGIAVGWFLARRLHARALRVILWCEAASLLAAGLLGFVATSDTPWARIGYAGMFLFGVVAMALQTSFCHAAQVPMTTVMTANACRLTFCALDAWKGCQPLPSSVRLGLFMVAAFTLGALGAGLGIRVLGAGLLIVAVGPVLLVSVIVPRACLLRAD